MQQYDDLSCGLFIQAFIESQFSMIPLTGLKRFIKTNLPYACHPTGRGDYITLNREYKPLGWPVDRPAFIDYGDPMWAPFCFYPADQLPGDGFTLLYGPGTEPWSSPDAMNRYADLLSDMFGCFA